MAAHWDRLPSTVKIKPTRRPAARGTFRCAGPNGCGELMINVTVQAALRHADTHHGSRLELITEPTIQGES